MDKKGARIGYSDAAPRLVDVALLLCEGAIRHLWTQLRVQPSWAETLYLWYLKKIAFLQVSSDAKEGHGQASCGDLEDDPTTDALRVPSALDRAAAAVPQGSPAASPLSSPCRTRAGVTSYRRPTRVCGDVDFSHAFEEAALPASKYQQSSPIAEAPKVELAAAETEEHTKHCRRREGDVERDRATIVAGAAALTTPSTQCDDDGLALLREFLTTLQSAGGPTLAAEAVVVLRRLIGDGAVAGNTNTHSLSHCDDISLELLSLAHLFEWDVSEEASVMALGSGTRSYRVWANVSWRCASFTHQSRLAATAERWGGELAKYDSGTTVAPSGYLSRDLQAVNSAASAMASAACLADGRGDWGALNIGGMYGYIREVFEGHARAEKTLLGLLYAQARPVQADDNYAARLLSSQDPPLSTTVSWQELINYGSQPILHSITCGMLLYTRYYLRAHSLVLARQCAQMAVLVAHQLRSNSTLALAHYGCFLAHFACGRAAEAADNIAIALQLSVSPDAVEPGELGVGSLSFMGATLLLLLCPATVGSSLRSVLTTEPSSWGAGGREDGTTTGGHYPSQATNHGPDAAGGSLVGGGGHTMVVQTLPQTVRNALLLSEVEAYCHPVPGHAWVEVSGLLSRESLMLIGSMYGLTLSPLVMSRSFLGRLLAQIEDEAVVSPPSHHLRPSAALLTEVIRHTGHHALAIHEANLNRDTAGPIGIVCSALQAVNDHYGSAGVDAAVQDTFFSSLTRYLVASWLATNGFIASALEGMTEVVYHLYHTAGMDISANGFRGGGADADTIQEWAACATRELFIPPDHLLLLAYVQLRRCELALYLGYSATLEEASAALLALSTRADFAFGVLAAQYIELLRLQQKCDHSGMLVASAQLLHSAREIGYTALALSVRMRRVSASCGSARWSDALDELTAVPQPIPRRWRTAYALARLNVGSEVIMQAVGAGKVSEMTLSSFVSQGTEVLRACGHVGSSTADVLRFVECGDSDGVTLQEVLCIHNSLLRATQLVGETSGHASLEEEEQHQQRRDELMEALTLSADGLTRVLGQRHLRKGLWARIKKGSLIATCEAIICGEIISTL